MDKAHVCISNTSTSAIRIISLLSLRAPGIGKTNRKDSLTLTREEPHVPNHQETQKCLRREVSQDLQHKAEERALMPQIRIFDV